MPAFKMSCFSLQALSHTKLREKKHVKKISSKKVPLDCVLIFHGPPKKPPWAQSTKAAVLFFNPCLEFSIFLTDGGMSHFGLKLL